MAAERGSPVRRGGRGRIADGAWLTWSQAEGGRGTRWRESIEADGAITRVTLLETTTADRLVRLEIAAPAGLLTLHPDREESTVHGNLVGPDGVRHLRFDWSPDHEVLLLRSPAAATVTLRRLSSTIEVGMGRTVGVLRIDDRLDPRPTTWSFERTADRAWHLRALEGAEERVLALDATGRPVLTDALEWPLEE